MTGVDVQEAISPAYRENWTADLAGCSAGTEAVLTPMIRSCRPTV